MAQKHDLKYVIGGNFFEIRGIIFGQDQHVTYIATRQLAERYIDDFMNSRAGKESEWTDMIIIEHSMITDIK